MVENNENGTANSPYTGKTVKIRTNIGWVQVVTSADGWVTKEAFEAAITTLQNEKLAKTDKINKEMAEQIYANSADISNRFE